MKSRLAFSNGTEFAIWSDQWCNRCVKDEAARHDDFENGCPILAASYCEEEVPEWSEDPSVDGWPNVICSEFEPLCAPKEP